MLATWGSSSGFNVASLFSAGEQGAWYDPSDLTTLFQNSTGTTPVTAVEQAVGLILDKSKGLVLGPEAWAGFGTITSPWTNAGGGVFTIDGSQAGNRDLSQNPQFTTNKRYLVTFTLSGVTGGTLQVFVGEGSGVSLGNGSYTYRANASQAYLIFRAPAGVAATVSAVSVKELPGNHAFQSTDASRPTLRARYNLLTYSEQFDNAAWQKNNTTVSSNATTAPDGTLTADKMIETVSGLVGHGVQFLSGFSYALGNVFTLSCYAKAAERSVVILRIDGVTSNFGNAVYFDLSTGTASQVAAGVTASIVSVGSGWYRVSATAAATASGSGGPVISVGDSPTGSAGGDSYAGDGTSGIYIWGAQLLTAADATTTGNAYQRIAAATDYVTTSTMGGYTFLPYLAFDGSDDSLLTNSVDFTGTDKMTVWSGVTKLSDAAGAILAELTSSSSTNNGSFLLSAPFDTTFEYAFRSRGTSGQIATVDSATYASPNTSVLTGIGNIGGDVVSLRINGSLLATDTNDQGTGNYSNAALFIGRRNNATNPLNGRLYSLIVRGAASNATQISATENWVASKTGVAL